MDTKEKAEQLVNKFKTFNFQDAKILALICAEEVIEYSKGNEEVRNTEGDLYWIQVKKDIISL